LIEKSQPFHCNESYRLVRGYSAEPAQAHQSFLS
jgi:hypothetical protein